MRRALVLGLALAACGGGSDGGPRVDAASGDATAADAAGDFTACTGACAETELVAQFGATTRLLTHAVYGVTQQPPSLHVEVYGGGAGGCPTETSPTPDYTVVLGRVTIPTSTQTSISPGHILDFKGDLLGGRLGTEALMATVMPTAADAVQPAPMGFVALDVALTFNDGTVTGHLYATHCASLDAAN